MKSLITFFALTLSLSLAQNPFLADEIKQQSECGVCCSTLSARPSMNFTFYLNTGRFVGGSGEWTIETYGYSGNNTGYLNPEAMCESFLGPLPAAEYNITYCKDTMHVNSTMPCAFYLNPLDESQMCGRDDFFIHGCKVCTEGDLAIPPPRGCSAGCIVVNYLTRIKLRVGDFIKVIKYDPISLTETENGISQKIVF